MINNILFDFDGVILDSMKIKGDGFVKLFEDYDYEIVKRLEEFHYNNGGVSRFEKIRYFFEIQGKDVSNDEIEEHANKYSVIIKEKIFNHGNLINETINFIRGNFKKYNFHIVSGAEHFELNNLCEFFNLSGYFISINGSPARKSYLINQIIEKYQYGKDETILIGDSVNDYEAARENSIKFFGYNNPNLKKISDKYLDSYDCL